MCTLAIYFQEFPDYPIVVAANRDEFLDRPSAPPALLGHNPGIVGGKDLRAGGTWLGINQTGLLAGLLNRRSEKGGDPNRRSRGLLCREVLQHRTLQEAVGFLSAQRGGDYNPFNLLAATPDAAYVAYNFGDAITVHALEKGVHLLTNLNLNDATCPRISRSHRLFTEAGKKFMATGSLEGFLSGLRAALSDHITVLDPREENPLNSLCVHTETYGTRSSSLLLYSRPRRQYLHYFAPGPPCQHPYREILLWP